MRMGNGSGAWCCGGTIGPPKEQEDEGFPHGDRRWRMPSLAHVGGPTLSGDRGFGVSPTNPAVVLRSCRLRGRAVIRPARPCLLLDQVADEKHWPEIRALILVVSAAKKDTSSTSGTCVVASLCVTCHETLVPGSRDTLAEAYGSAWLGSARVYQENSTTEVSKGIPCVVCLTSIGDTGRGSRNSCSAVGIGARWRRFLLV